jgi:hypothetical protein
MKNELKITLEGGNWFYFKTHQETADKAFQEFEETLDNAGINTDNINYKEAILRNSTGDDIDRISFT